MNKEELGKEFDMFFQAAGENIQFSLEDDAVSYEAMKMILMQNIGNFIARIHSQVEK